MADDEVQDDLLMLMMSTDLMKSPQPQFAELRAKGGGVMRQEGVAAVLGHDEVEFAFRHPETFSSAMGAIGLGNVRPLIPLQIDPPEHKKYRKLLDPLFAPREVARLENDVAKLTNDLIDTFIDRGECEFDSEFAVPLPCTVFLRLLGLPYSDLDLFLSMKDNIIRPGNGTLGLDEETRIRNETGQQLYEYFYGVLDDRAKNPKDDLLTQFLEAEVEGHRLTREDILDICFLFLIAGLDTVTCALDCNFAYLAQHPDQRQKIVNEPEIIPLAIEELLRWESVVPGVVRIATQDTELGGCPIKAGDLVSVMVGSANTDANFYDRAMEVDLTRSPNPHYAFGGGVHRCLGSHLARLELRVATREWHRRIPEYSIKPGVELSYTAALRQIENLPILFHA